MSPDLRAWLSSRAKGSEFIRRLGLLVYEIGGPERAAVVAEVQPATVHRWLDLVEEPGFVPLALLALHSGISLDWLAFGEFGPVSRRAA